MTQLLTSLRNTLAKENAKRTFAGLRSGEFAMSISKEARVGLGYLLVLSWALAASAQIGEPEADLTMPDRLLSGL